MEHSILLEGKLPDEIGKVTLSVNQTIEINISADKTRKQVNQYVHLEISAQLHAGPPMLVVDPEGTSFWRVPVHLTLPAYGDVGRVGFLHVNPQTGVMDSSPVLILSLTQAADVLARRFASPTAHPI
ncbi:MAG TPA: hypothetical protein PLD25_32450 [Chloroflexota bacterium]|nr:hypothetical protein [Chloroflexota bacterium]HUM68134.1 hypothetical protein [Chloroflexota bacterium]